MWGRGIYTAAYLDELGRRYATYRDTSTLDLDLGKGFDLVVGTSTGAIIVAALAKGIAPATILEMYQEESANIFPVKFPNGVNCKLLKQLLTRPKHLESGEKALSKALENVFGMMTIGELYQQR